MADRILVAPLAAAVCTASVIGLAGLAPPASSAAATREHVPAPGAPGAEHTWSPGDKDGFGTSRSTASKVWYTLNDGALTEVFYPRVDTPSVRDLQLVVTDGRTFADREDTATVRKVELADRRSLTYRQVNTARSGRYRITKTYATDPARDALLVDVRFESLTGRPYQVYVLHDPALNMTGDDDTGGSAAGGALLARDGAVANAVVAAPALTATSSGYLGASDGWTDLRGDFRLDWRYTAATPGNVVQVGRTALTGRPGAQRLTLALGFGAQPGAALRVAEAALGAGFGRVQARYAAGWRAYLSSLRPRPASVRSWARIYDVSAMALAAHEDKTYRGGFVAAPARPWAWANELQDLAVYHAVWSRDLYQIATGLLAAGDRAAASRALDYLFTVQQRPDGSFPQNSRLDGTPVFGDLQMDEVAFPIVLAWQLRRFGPADWDRVRRSADYLVANGPRTPQERWENAGGFSPATIAAEIAGLVCAADIAQANGDAGSAATYRATADRWRAGLDAQTRTTTGPLDPDPYYLRITADGDADAGTRIQISDGGPLVDQRAVVDPSFLELVRLGVKRARDPGILNTNEVVDRELSYLTRNGRFWHRASFDGYGEKRDGSQWEPSPAGSRLTVGRGWPLLSGERGEWALVAGRPAQTYLDAMARAADDDSLLMAEQVWDDQPPSGRGPRFVPGEPTFSATPLAWTHAQFLRLAASIDAGRPVETPQNVACRYRSEACRAIGPAATGPAGG
jgi:glucoamylase